MKKRIFSPTILVLFFGLTFSSASANENVEILKKTFEEGIIAYNRGEFEKSIPFFEKSIQMYPLAPAYNYLALAKRSTGANLDEVVILFEKAIELDPNFSEAYENLGKVYYSLGNFEDAQTNVRKSLELNPNSLSARLSLAWIELLGFSKGGEAIPHFEFALPYSNIPQTYFGLGMAYIQADEKFKALDMITTLRQKGEENMAMQLERMMTEGAPSTFLKNNAPVIIPNPQPSILVSEPFVNNNNNNSQPQPNSAHKNMKVRLSSSPIGLAPPQQGSAPAATGEDRIKQLQGY